MLLCRSQVLCCFHCAGDWVLMDGVYIEHKAKIILGKAGGMKSA